jgi:hypothetical protein
MFVEKAFQEMPIVNLLDVVTLNPLTEPDGTSIIYKDGSKAISSFGFDSVYVIVAVSVAFYVILAVIRSPG